MATIEVKNIVSGGFPPDQGKILAEQLLQDNSLRWDDLQIDLGGIPASLIISAFFNGFLQEIYDRRSADLEKARKLYWVVPYDFQKKSIEKWVREFKPVRDDAGTPN